MRRLLAVLVICLAGCSGFQANRSSEAVDLDLSAIGTGNPAVAPSNAPGYMDGLPMDMRTR